MLKSYAIYKSTGNVEPGTCERLQSVTASRSNHGGPTRAGATSLVWAHPNRAYCWRKPVMMGIVLQSVNGRHQFKYKFITIEPNTQPENQYYCYGFLGCCCYGTRNAVCSYYCWTNHPEKRVYSGFTPFYKNLSKVSNLWKVVFLNDGHVDFWGQVFIQPPNIFPISSSCLAAYS